MSNQYELGRKNIEALYNWYRKNTGARNEATTRLHLIDTLLFECLAWDKRTDADSEERFAGKYTDYTLKCPRRALIVEAKKEGMYFDIPSGYSNGRYQIKTLKRDVRFFADAFAQASGYCKNAEHRMGQSQMDISLFASSAAGRMAYRQKMVMRLCSIPLNQCSTISGCYGTYYQNQVS